MPVSSLSLLVRLETELHPVRDAFTDDEITDLIETIVDFLDEFGHDPSVGTARDGSFVHLTIDLFFAPGVSQTAAIEEASRLFHAALVATGGLDARAEDTGVRVLTPA